MELQQTPNNEWTEQEVAEQPPVDMPEQPPQDELAEQPSEQELELERLRARISELEQQMVEREQLSERIREECAEFEQYFPDVSLRRVPDEVWGQVRGGIPLSAAYALYEKKQTAKQEAYRLRNEQSAARSAGLPESAPQQYFSPAEVRAMSQREVRDNYDRIFESMRHWQ